MELQSRSEVMFTRQEVCITLTTLSVQEIKGYVSFREDYAVAVDVIDEYVVCKFDHRGNSGLLPRLRCVGTAKLNS